MLGSRWGGARDKRAAWFLLLFFVLGVLAPTGTIFWFMREAARSQVDAARERTAEAYLGQLRLLRGQVDDWMHSRSSLLGDKAEAGTAKDFLLVLRASSADSVVLLDAHGRARYPNLPAPPTRDAVAGDAAWRAARALENQHNFDNAAAEFSRLAASAYEPSLYARAVQSEIRCLVRGGHKKGAVATILSRFSGERAMKATDLRPIESAKAAQGMPGGLLVLPVLVRS